MDSRSQYLRLSVSERCDLRCRYCRRPGPSSPHRRGELDRDELLRLVELIHEVTPLRKVRLTGGEPLLRRDIVEIVGALRGGLPGAALALTTNGGRLAPLARPLRRAGLDALNLSLDAVDPELFTDLTRGGRLEPVLEGLVAARRAGLRLKLNTVLLASYNAGRLAEIVRLALAHEAEPRFIELMPLGVASELFPREFFSSREALAELERTFEPLGPLGRSGAAVRHAFRDGGRVFAVGLITPVSSPFCATCDRLRLDAGGRLLTCLRRSEAVELAPPLRRGDVGEVRRRVAAALARKRPPRAEWAARDMADIGG